MDQKTFDKYVLKTYNRYPITIVRGRGMSVWDENGKEYLDFFPGYGTGNLGHCHPRVVAALHRQIDEILHVPNIYYNDAQGELAKLIIENSIKGQVFFCNSGAEANEGAIKLARKCNPDKKIIITLKNSFHGRTIAAITATGQPAYHDGFDPLPGGFVYCEVNDIEMLREMMNASVAAIMIEPILGEGGIIPLSSEFIQTARQLCNDYNALLILDEVQSGIGRTGRMFAYQHFGIEPDILTMAKSLAGGIPIGAFAVKRKYCKVLQPGNHGSTFGGNPVACSAGVAVLKAIAEENLLDNATKMGNYLHDRLEVLKSKYDIIKEVRGIGLMLGMELTIPGAEVVKRCQAKKILLNCTHETVLRLMPAINVTKYKIDRLVKVLDDVLNTMTTWNT
jgi:acetylornithine/N-succinyldiaminopimelate aminotransferase